MKTIIKSMVQLLILFFAPYASTIIYTPSVQTIAIYEVGPGGLADKSKHIMAIKECVHNKDLESKRSPFAIDDSVIVEWRDIWYKGVITQIYGDKPGQQKFRIHYEGWDKKWDEVVSYDRILHLTKCENQPEKNNNNTWILVFITENHKGEISKVAAISGPKAKEFSLDSSIKSQVECLKHAGTKNAAMDEKDRENKWWTCEPKGLETDGISNEEI